LAATTKKLGYPSVGALRQWIREFQSSDKLHKKYQGSDLNTIIF